VREHPLTVPEIMLIGGTRVALGAGLALLLTDRLKPDVRRAVGWALFAVGAATTVPLALNVLSKSSDARPEDRV
jgi:4-amino-4-deoxy-L-arabinose transferase-like glycosyltransferase